MARMKLNNSVYISAAIVSETYINSYSLYIEIARHCCRATRERMDENYDTNNIQIQKEKKHVLN